MALKIRVQSPKVKYTEDCIEAQYEYQTTNVTEDDTKYTVSIPRMFFFSVNFSFRFKIPFKLFSIITFIKL